MHALDVSLGEKMQQLGCKTYQCDLSSQNSINAFVESFQDRQLDLLLNIAGEQRPSNLLSPSSACIASDDGAQALWPLMNKIACLPYSSQF